MLPDELPIADAFHSLFYQGPQGQGPLWRTVSWLGVPAWKLPLDLFIFQEIVCETRPELIIECGVNCGGSTLFLAGICEAIDCGRILACDLNLAPVAAAVRAHSRIELIESSSTSPGFVSLARGRAAGRRTMLILDSDHSARHVLQELRLLAPLVSPGCYLICEDTNLNGRPVAPRMGPGPAEALSTYLQETGALWQVDRRRERFLVTFNPGGYLRRLPDCLGCPRTIDGV